MISEGELRADRIGREITRISKIRGVQASEIESIAYIVLMTLIVKENHPDNHSSYNRRSEEFESTADSFLQMCKAGDTESIEAHYERVLRALLIVLDLSPNNRWQPSSDSSKVISQIVQILIHELSNLDNSGKTCVVDMLYYRLFTRLVPSQRRHHELIAHLAAPLADLYGGVSEWQPGPSEVLIAAGFRDDNLNLYQDGESSLPRDLRSQLLVIRSLRMAVYNHLHGNRRLVQNTHYLNVVDTTVDLVRFSVIDLPAPYAESEVLNALVRLRQDTQGPQLVVVKARECRSLKRNAYARERLLRFYGLRAVVDFHSPTTKGTANLVLLVFGHERRTNDESVLQIDTRQFCSGLKDFEVLPSASLIGELLRAWVKGGEVDKARLENTLAPRRLIKFVEEAFQSGNSEVPGFYRIARADQMVNLEYSLRAESYVGKSSNRTWQPEVEIEPILKSLRQDRQSRAVYLIGNNGAGKSLAMRDVAMALAMEGHTSLGVAFGNTDRFQRSPGSDPLKSLFTYAGARTFQSGPNARRTNGQLGDMVKHIYRNPERLRCFDVALETLGFRPRHFLVPVGMRSTSDHWDRLLADVYPLTASSTSELERRELDRWQALPDGAYKFALMRRESPEIVVFDSLSSGEQQILTMMIKIIAGVQPNTTVLLDEPEISLHVAWQRQLPLVLREFSRGLNCSFVVATHSPVVIASADNKNDHCFVMLDRRLHELDPTQRRSVEASLFEGFNTYTPYTHHVQERCAEIISRVIADSDEDGSLNKNDQGPLKELQLLKQRLLEGPSPMAQHDIVLVDKALAAVHEILTS